MEPARVTRMRDGRASQIGADLDVGWIMDGTDEGGVKITCAIPPAFEAYWTLELPYSGDHDWRPHEVDRFAPDVVDVLAAHTPEQPWWLGYVQRGPDSNIIFDDAPQVALYNGGYVIVEAGPEQAAAWRGDDRRDSPQERLPDVMFPHDRLWLASHLWDDDWTYFGGPGSLQGESDDFAWPHRDSLKWPLFAMVDVLAG